MTDLSHADLFAPWGTPVERERRRRVLLTAAAYAYELASDPIMSDDEFDALAQASRPYLHTGRPGLDLWWSAMFQPHTGQWIHSHPELAGAERWYRIIRHGR